MHGKLKSLVVLVFSLIAGIWVYMEYFLNMLPRFFPNMENIEKTILSMAIVVLTIYVLLKLVLGMATKWDRYALLLAYFTVLIFGLLRPDGQYSIGTGDVSWNPIAFLSDIQGDRASQWVMVINLIIFVPMYFLLAVSNVLKGFKGRFFLFQGVAWTLEWMQHILNVGQFDLSDLLLYTVGFLIGYGIALPILKVGIGRYPVEAVRYRPMGRG